MRVFVTGASGFIGKYVCECLAGNGMRVVALCRLMEASMGVQADEKVFGDIASDSFVDEVSKKIERCEVIVHLAASIAVPGCSDTITTNIYGTKNVIDLAKKWDAGRLIYLSSIPVIGLPAHIPVTEKHAVAPRTLYHMSKYIGEKMIEMGDMSGVPTILRISSPIGIGMKRDSFLSVILNKFKNHEDVEIYGNGERVQNYVDVRDLAELIGTCALEAGAGLYLIGGRTSYSNKDVAKMCKNITGSSSKIIFGKHSDPEEGCKWIISSRKAVSELGYSPRFELAESIEWVCKGSQL